MTPTPLELPRVDILFGFNAGFLIFRYVWLNIFQGHNKFKIIFLLFIVILSKKFNNYQLADPFVQFDPISSISMFRQNCKNNIIQILPVHPRPQVQLAILHTPPNDLSKKKCIKKIVILIGNFWPVSF